MKTKLKKQNSKMKIDKITAFMFIAGIWSIDFLTTIIALKVVNDGSLVEANSIASWFQSFGLIGWIGSFIFTMLLLMGLVWIIDKSTTRFKYEKTRQIYWWMIILVWVVVEGAVIFNNVFQIRGII